jgi:hypothetical protein
MLIVRTIFCRFKSPILKKKNFEHSDSIGEPLG